MNGVRINCFSKVDFILFFFVVLILLYLFWVLPPLALSTNDEGVKFIQMKNFHLHHSLNIKYPGEQLSLGLEYLAPNQYLFVQKEGKLFSNYPPLFPYLSSLFYPIVGDRVTYILPFLSFFLSLIVLSRTFKIITTDKYLYYLLLLAFLIGSPVVIYTFTFYEHLPAVFCVVCSLYFLVRYFYVRESKVNIFLSAFIMGFASFFRSEIILLSAAYTISLGYTLYSREKYREVGALIAGIAIPAAALAIFNYVNYQNVMGLHISFNFQLFQGYLFHRDKTIVTAFVLVCLVALVYICKREKLDQVIKERIYLFAGILLFMFIVIYYQSLTVSDLIIKFPLSLMLIFGIVIIAGRSAPPPSAFGYFIIGSLVIFIWLVAYLFSPYQQGVRFALPLIPFILLFIASEHKRIFIARPMYMIFIALTLFATSQIFLSMKNDLWFYASFNAKRVEFLEKNTAKGDVIIFSAKPYLHHAGPLFFDRVYMVASGSSGCGANALGNEEKLLSVLSILRDRKVKTCYFWTDDPRILTGQKKFRVETAVFSPIRTQQHFLHKIYIL